MAPYIIGNFLTKICERAKDFFKLSDIEDKKSKNVSHGGDKSGNRTIRKHYDNAGAAHTEGCNTKNRTG